MAAEEKLREWFDRVFSRQGGFGIPDTSDEVNGRLQSLILQQGQHLAKIVPQRHPALRGGFIGIGLLEDRRVPNVYVVTPAPGVILVGISKAWVQAVKETYYYVLPLAWERIGTDHGLKKAALLLEIAIDFILWHELHHAICGHCKSKATGSNRLYSEIAAADSMRMNPRRAMRIKMQEWEADRFAALTAFLTWRKFSAGHSGNATITWVTSISLLCCLFHSLSNRAPAVTHPPPQLRMFNCIFSIAEWLSKNEAASADSFGRDAMDACSGALTLWNSVAQDEVPLDLSDQEKERVVSEMVRWNRRFVIFKRSRSLFNLLSFIPSFRV